MDSIPDILEYQDGLNKPWIPADDVRKKAKPNHITEDTFAHDLRQQNENALKQMNDQKEIAGKRLESHRSFKDAKVVHIPHNEEERKANKAMFEAGGAQKVQRVDLHQGPGDSARLLAEYNEKMQERHAPKTTAAPPKRRTVPPFDEKRMEHALRQYQVAVQKDKRADKGPDQVAVVTPREDHLRVVKHEQVLEARVEHDVLGNYEPVQQPVVQGPGNYEHVQ